MVAGPRLWNTCHSTSTPLLFKSARVVSRLTCLPSCSSILLCSAYEVAFAINVSEMKKMYIQVRVKLRIQCENCTIGGANTPIDVLPGQIGQHIFGNRTGCRHKVGGQLSTTHSGVPEWQIHSVQSSSCHVSPSA